jgi:hypothetical protein
MQTADPVPDPPEYLQAGRLYGVTPDDSRSGAQISILYVPFYVGSHFTTNVEYYYVLVLYICQS